MLNPNLDYRTILKDEFEERCKHNRSYSLRAFARDLEVGSGRMTEILKGKQGVSRRSAIHIAAKLGYNDSERELFCDIVDSSCSRSVVRRKLAAIRLEKYRDRKDQTLTLDAFHVIADWYHFAILELCQLKGFKSDINWIAKRLGIAPKLIELAIDRLLRLDLLEMKENGEYVTREEFTASPSGMPSEAIKNFHTQVMEKALLALRTQSLSERDFSTMVFAFDKKQMPKAKEVLKEFRRNFSKHVGPSDDKNCVYALSMQLFQIDKDE